MRAMRARRHGHTTIRIAALCVGLAMACSRAQDILPPPAAGVPIQEGVAAGSPVLVRRIEVIGNTVFAPADIERLLVPFHGRALGPGDLEELRTVLTRRYIDAGYINSGALIPPQDIAGGVLIVQIVEGRLSAVRVSGEHHYRDDYLRRLLSPYGDRPLNVNRLQEQIQLLLQDGLLQQINAKLEPGDAPGQSILDAAVHEGPRFKADFTVADDRPPSVGETGGTFGLSGRNLLGLGDSTALSFSRTGGYSDYGIDENIPLFMPGLSLFSRADRDHGSVVESSLADLGIISRETSVEGGISAQMMHSLRNSLIQSVSFYHNDTHTFLLGVPFSFSGDDNGHSEVSALRYAWDWSFRGTRQVAAAHSLINVGLGAGRIFGATRHEDSDLPDSRFVVWNSQAQYLRQLFGEDEVLARASLQLSSRNLLPSEQIAIGGIDTVRGYAANTLVTDQGGFASLEYRHTVYHLRVPGISREANDGGLALAAFYDVGAGGDKGTPHTWISGTGGGIRWSPSSTSSLVFYKAVTLHRLSTQGDGLQDQGLHFRISYELAF
jgi:hemolysin activation/secretion protein